MHEVHNILDSNKMIIAFQPEALDARKRTQICNKLFAAGFSVIFYPVDILRSAYELKSFFAIFIVFYEQL